MANLTVYNGSAFIKPKNFNVHDGVNWLKAKAVHHFDGTQWVKDWSNGFNFFVSPDNGVLRKVNLDGETQWSITITRATSHILDCAIDWENKWVYVGYTTDSTGNTFTISKVNLATGDIITHYKSSIVLFGIRSGGGRMSLSPDKSLISVGKTNADDQSSTNNHVFMVFDMQSDTIIYKTNIAGRNAFFASNGCVYGSSFAVNSSGSEFGKLYPSKARFNGDSCNAFSIGLRNQIAFAYGNAYPAAVYMYFKKHNVATNAFIKNVGAGDGFSYTFRGVFYNNANTYGIVTRKGVRFYKWSDDTFVKSILVSYSLFEGFTMPDGRNVVASPMGEVYELLGDDSLKLIANTSAPISANERAINCFRCEPAHECTFPELFPL